MRALVYLLLPLTSLLLRPCCSAAGVATAPAAESLDVGRGSCLVRFHSSYWRGCHSGGVRSDIGRGSPDRSSRGSPVRRAARRMNVTIRPRSGAGGSPRDRQHPPSGALPQRGAPSRAARAARINATANGSREAEIHLGQGLAGGLDTSMANLRRKTPEKIRSLWTPPVERLCRALLDSRRACSTT